MPDAPVRTAGRGTRAPKGACLGVPVRDVSPHTAPFQETFEHMEAQEEFGYPWATLLGWGHGSAALTATVLGLGSAGLRTDAPGAPPSGWQGRLVSRPWGPYRLPGF